MRTFVEYGLANAVAATALAIVAVLVGMVIRRPAVRNALWVLVFVRLLMPPFWTIPLPIGSLQPQFEIRDIATPPALSVVDEPTRMAEFADRRESVEPVASDPVPHQTGPLEEAIVAAPPMPQSAGHSNSGFAVPSEISFWLACVWIAGSVVLFVRSAQRVVRFRRALEVASPAPAAIQQQAEVIARTIGLRNCPRILVVPGRVWPSLWMPGLLTRQAKLILPAGLLPLLDPEQRAAVLAHELSHLRRGDPWVRWLELIVCGVYWWHPLLGWFRRKLRESEEECCDMWVVAAMGGRKSYATALVETAGFLGDDERTPALVLASGAGPVRNLQRRVTMIMRATWPARLTRLGLAVVLGVGGLGLAFGPVMAQPERKDKERPRDVDRPKEGERAKDRPDGPPRERDVDRGRVDNREIQETREALERARKEAREAMARVQEFEARLARLEGRPIPPAGRPPMERGPGDRGPGDRGAPDRGPGDRGPMDPRRPGVGDAPRGGGELRDLQQQIEDLRRALDEVRRELRREGDRGRPGESRKDGDPRPKEGGRPGAVPERERPKDTDKPPVERRPERR